MIYSQQISDSTKRKTVSHSFNYPFTCHREKTRQGKKGANFKTSMFFTETNSFLYCLSSKWRHDYMCCQTGNYINYQTTFAIHTFHFCPRSYGRSIQWCPRCFCASDEDWRNSWTLQRFRTRYDSRLRSQCLLFHWIRICHVGPEPGRSGQLRPSVPGWLEMSMKKLPGST